MNVKIDSYQAAKDLIDEFGFDGATTVAIDQIARLYEGKDFYELSYWREIRKAISDLASQADDDSGNNAVKSL